MSSVGKYLNLMPHMSSWRVYLLGVSPVVGNEAGNVAPATFGGLSYRILDEPSVDLYSIQTESFGRVNIYAPRDADSSISSVPSFDNGGSPSGSGQYLNLQPHMTSWRVYPLGVSLVGGNETGSLAPSKFGGLSYRIIDEPSADVYTIQTESFGRVNIYAPRDPDSTLSNSAQFSDGGGTGSPGGGTGQFLNLEPHMTSWRVYPLGVNPVSGNEIGRLAPATYGGLSYEILAQPSPDLYTILTESFARVNIYAPRDNDSSFTASPLYTGSNSGGGSGLYLNLFPHMSSWRVYPLGVPLVRGNEVGNLGPSMFGGLSYKIIGSVGSDSYTISTESFGQVNIYAPRDNDSSITSSPLFGNTNDNYNPGDNVGNPGGSLGGLKVFLDAGHGGVDSGAVGNGLREKDVNLTITKKIGQILESRGAIVNYTRLTDNYTLYTSVAGIANRWGADLFVSIHGNASVFGARGTECYTATGASLATKNLSANLARAISNKVGTPNRGGKTEDFAVVRMSNMPAVLVETAFLTNSTDAGLLRTRPGDFASAIADEISRYLDISDSNPGTSTPTQEDIKKARETQISNYREALPILNEVFTRPSVEFENNVSFPYRAAGFNITFTFSDKLKTESYNSDKKVNVQKGSFTAEAGNFLKGVLSGVEEELQVDLKAGSHGLNLAAVVKEGAVAYEITNNGKKPVLKTIIDTPEIKVANGVTTTLSFEIAVEFDPSFSGLGLPDWVTKLMESWSLNSAKVLLAIAGIGLLAWGIAVAAPVIISLLVAGGVAIGAGALLIALSKAIIEQDPSLA